MKRNCLCISIFLFFIILVGAENKKDNYFETFFGTNDYQTDVYNILNHEMFFSYVYDNTAIRFFQWPFTVC